MEELGKKKAAGFVCLPGVRACVEDLLPEKLEEVEDYLLDQVVLEADVKDLKGPSIFILSAADPQTLRDQGFSNLEGLDGLEEDITKLTDGMDELLDGAQRLTDGARALDKGAALCLMGALFYAIYIVVQDRIAKGEDAFLISILQLGVASLLGLLASFLFEAPTLPQSPATWGAVVYLGLICSAYGFVVQPIAQKHAAPERIGLIFSLEPVFSALLSFLFLHEVLAGINYLGGGLIFLAVVLPELIKTPKQTAP